LFYQNKASKSSTQLLKISLYDLCGETLKEIGNCKEVGLDGRKIRVLGHILKK